MNDDEEERIPLVSSQNSQDNSLLSYGTVSVDASQDAGELPQDRDAYEFGLFSLPYEIVAYLFHPRDDLEDEVDDFAYEEDDERIPEDILPLINFLLALLITMFSFLVFTAFMAFILAQSHIKIWDLLS
jgi:hypothetical protein